ncbi:MAG TPA: phosphatase domain-containing protein [Longimicrobiales bacterium]|nr:phosphatase domain-containing protein [Longimicrobiales bacterium]
MDRQERIWSRMARRLALDLGARMEGLKARLARPAVVRPAIIDAYRGYGTVETLRVRGRVILDPGVRPARPGDRWWVNLMQAYRRLESDEVPFARVEVRHGSARRELVANEEGHFDGHVALAEPPTSKPWTTVGMRLVDASRPPCETEAAVFIPTDDARFGVISDMDDTVIRTDARSLWRMLRLTLFANAHTRVAFPGVSAFFRALHLGEDGATHNPLFYVSSSPWNLHDLLEHFLELNEIPEGPLVLRDWGSADRETLSTSHHHHKLTAIRDILHTYPHLPFILIGDSGQADPEIYRDVVHEFPSRILAAYIRDVTLDPMRKQSIQELATEVKSAGSSLVLASDTLAAARHAAEHGWITADILVEIEGRAGSDRAQARADGESTERGRTVVVEG